MDLISTLNCDLNLLGKTNITKANFFRECFMCDAQGDSTSWMSRASLAACFPMFVSSSRSLRAVIGDSLTNTQTLYTIFYLLNVFLDIFDFILHSQAITKHRDVYLFNLDSFLDVKFFLCLFGSKVFLLG